MDTYERLRSSMMRCAEHAATHFTFYGYEDEEKFAEEQSLLIKGLIKLFILAEKGELGNLEGTKIESYLFRTPYVHIDHDD